MTRMQLQDVSFVLACIINVLILLSYGVESPTSGFPTRDDLIHSTTGACVMAEHWWVL